MKNPKLYNKRIRFIFLMILVSMFFFLACEKKEQEEEGTKQQDASLARLETSMKEVQSSNLKITMLNVGQGLSLLLTCDGESMIYDGGGKSTSSYVVSYLKNHNIGDLKYMIASHYDEDHIAGLVGVLNRHRVETAILPDSTAETYIYQSLCEKMESEDVHFVYAQAGDSYHLGQAEISILAPESYDSENENNSSIVVSVRLGDFSCMITGDAEEQEEEYLLDSYVDLSSTLYVVGHHGSSTSSSQAFLQAMNPDYAFLSVGEDNSYGHPTEATMNRLEKLGLAMFRTDIQGEVTLETDGKSWFVDKDPCQDYSHGTYGADEVIDKSMDSEQEDNKHESAYVINTNTMKFHFPTCSSVKQMKDHNKAYSDSSREELMEEGYSPCGNCKP